MPLSIFIEDLLRNKERASTLFNKEGFKKVFTPQHKDELIQVADKGDQWAQYYVGMLPLHCIWGSSSLIQTGWIYRFGVGVTQDRTKAMEYCLKSANQGNPFAQYNIGIHSSHSNIVHTINY